MNHVICVGFLCLVLALVFLGYSTAENNNRKEKRASDRSLLKNIFSGRNKRQLKELCDQSSMGCIFQDFKENKKRMKRKKKRKNRNRVKNNKRKMDKQKQETIATCPHLDAPTDVEDDLEDEEENEQCPQVQQTING
ncbi:hypothetical protein ACROYT_G024199 [Oculina patagonica]